MKRLILPLSLLLTLIATAPLFAVDSSQRPTLVQDVIRMTQGGVSDQAIIAFVQNRRGTFTITADDMIAMSDAKVSKDVMSFVANGAAPAEQAVTTQPANEPPNDQNWRDRRSTEAEERTEEARETTRTVVVPRVYVSPWYWDPWYYDPFWYGPRLSLNFGFGYYGGYRGHYYGGGHYGGGHGGGGHWGGGPSRPGGGGGIIRRGR